MKDVSEKIKYEISASGKKLGRVATEIANVLMGKNTPDFSAHKVANIYVEVSGVQEIDISDKKMMNKKYKRYSGYPGGQTEESAKSLSLRKGVGELLKIAVRGMLPSNRLTKERMKRLIIKT